MRDLEKLQQAYARQGLLGVLRGARRRAWLRVFEAFKTPFHRGPTPDPVHAVFHRFVEEVNALERPRVLEIGSRARSGNVQTHRFPRAEYVGFDVLAGENVQVTHAYL
jgi:hypothetical protein